MSLIVSYEAVRCQFVRTIAFEHAVSTISNERVECSKTRITPTTHFEGNYACAAGTGALGDLNSAFL